MRTDATTGDAAAIATDALLLPCFEGAPLPAAIAELDRALGGQIARMREQGESNAAYPTRQVLATQGRIPSQRLVLLGLGRAQELDGYRLRNAIQFAVRDVRRFCRTLAILVDESLVTALADNDPLQGEPPAVARALAEGVALGNYHLGQLKTGEDSSEVKELSVLGLGDGGPIREALTQGALLAQVTNRTRWLQWQPSNHMTPTELAREAERLASEHALELEVLDRSDMERLGMGSLLAVAQGSHEPPKLVALRYRPKAATDADKVLGLVGKGITFDTGGISLKPNPGMSRMKADMSGAAAVIEAMALISEMKAPIQVLGVAAITENMPGGGAIKPGDVVTAMNGTTIEINNTDAEGRLVLADALNFAADRGATHLVDAATLTGGAVVALGQAVTAAMGTSPELLQQLRRAGALAGERIWELPLFPEYDIALKCEVADIHNTSGTPGASAINGAIFLRQFTGGLPWVHLDIAGSAYHMEALWAPVVPKGPSGVMTRTFAHLPWQMV